MEVNGVTSDLGQIIQVVTTVSTDQTPEDLPENGDVSQPLEVEPQPDIQEQDDADDAKGVIDLLLAGHFKGVSDVRLRISHFAQLAAIQNEQTQGSR